MGGQLWLPTTGASRTVEFGPWRIFGEDGTVCWENQDTGQFFQVEPAKAKRVAQRLFEDVLGKSLEGSIANDRQQYKLWHDALQRVVEIADDQLRKFNDSVGRIITELG